MSLLMRNIAGFFAVMTEKLNIEHLKPIGWCYVVHIDGICFVESSVFVVSCEKVVSLIILNVRL